MVNQCKSVCIITFQKIDLTSLLPKNKPEFMVDSRKHEKQNPKANIFPIPNI
uniref:Uncharacterized protein n=1 Tax=Tetranychus urticae TaxID=32264 RepID=T1KD86_TETUR